MVSDRGGDSSILLNVYFDELLIMTLAAKSEQHSWGAHGYDIAGSFSAGIAKGCWYM